MKLLGLFTSQKQCQKQFLKQLSPNPYCSIIIQFNYVLQCCLKTCIIRTNMLAGNIGPCTDVYLTAEWVCRELRMTFQPVTIFFVLIHCSMVVKTSDLSVWCLSLHWNEFKSHLIRSGNFVCVCFCLFLFGGIFCIRWESYNFFWKLLSTEFLLKDA